MPVLRARARQTMGRPGSSAVHGRRPEVWVGVDLRFGESLCDPLFAGEEGGLVAMVGRDGVGGLGEGEHGAGARLLRRQLDCHDEARAEDGGGGGLAVRARTLRARLPPGFAPRRPDRLAGLRAGGLDDVEATFLAGTAGQGDPGPAAGAAGRGVGLRLRNCTASARSRCTSRSLPLNPRGVVEPGRSFEGVEVADPAPHIERGDEADPSLAPAGRIRQVRYPGTSSPRCGAVITNLRHARTGGSRRPGGGRRGGLVSR
jgi:hypothetical protein